jgi:Holliday junction resolvasome RuvABC endonuclease subunit
MKKTNHTILAIDPGITHLGYAVLRGSRLAAAGVHAIRVAGESARQREIRAVASDWLKDFRPLAVVLEATYHHRQPVFESLHRTAKTIESVVRKRRLTVYTVSVRTVRRVLAGNGNATKQELARAIAILFPTLRVYLKQDRRWKERYFANMFDAVALAVFHKVRRPF